MSDHNAGVTFPSLDEALRKDGTAMLMINSEAVLSTVSAPRDSMISSRLIGSKTPQPCEVGANREIAFRLISRVFRARGIVFRAWKHG